MKDEEYIFVSDVRDKKITARSARNTRTHNGKRGRVKLPSDYLTKKELKAMSGEMKSYKLNDPMSWREFKTMPDDLKETYIKLIRQKFNPYDSDIAEMMGIHRVTFAKEMKRLNLGVGKNHGGVRTWDKEGWLKWSKGIPTTEEIVQILSDNPTECEEQAVEAVAEKESELDKVIILRKAIPCSGSMTFNGKAEDSLKTMLDLLCGADVRLTITWETCDG